jgi:[CysO sulfur-carrier protein]-S-L-cysteine hydrolase
MGVTGNMMGIPKTVYERMMDHAKKCYPQEACGFVIGQAGHADDFIVMENIEHSSVSYAMDPKQQIKVFKRLQDEKKELLGIFHSHVASPAEPSQKDKAMAYYPEVSYLIASLSDMDSPDLKSYRIQGDQISSEEIQIT